MNSEKKQEIKEFALDTADKFEYLIKILKKKAKSKDMELSTLEKIMDEIHTTYSELREYVDEKTGKSTFTPSMFMPEFIPPEGSF